MRWELHALTDELEQCMRGSDKTSADESAVVIRYFELVGEENEARRSIEALNSGVITGDIDAYYAYLAEMTKQRLSIETQAENILEKQINRTLSEAGIYNPLDSYLNIAAVFPPVKLRLQEPPRLLVVSPRDVIKRLATFTLSSGMTPDEISALEDSVSALGVSALVVDLGGIATYPSFVNAAYGLSHAISTAIEEWLHQYLFFRPLGVRYALNELGMRQPYEIIIMNETLVGMISQELSRALYQHYYAPYLSQDGQEDENPVAIFDFNSEMRNIRQTVDSLLEQGDIETAEAFMDEKRIFLASQGFFIRKLNQAYFAFYGSYADTPGFTNPLYDDLKMLREKSASLADFLNAASAIASYKQLQLIADQG